MSVLPLRQGLAVVTGGGGESCGVVVGRGVVGAGVVGFGVVGTGASVVVWACSGKATAATKGVIHTFLRFIFRPHQFTTTVGTVSKT